MRCLPFAASLAIACGASHPRAVQPDAPETVFRDGFDDPSRIQRAWTAATPAVTGALARIEDETLQLVLPTTKDEIAVRHRLDLSAIRGKRVRVQARARTSTPTSRARVTVTVVPASGVTSYADRASTRTVSSQRWTPIDTVIDVDRDAVSADVTLLLDGSGSAWFDDVAVSTIGDAPRPTATQLSAPQLEHIETLTRAFGYIRYLHPSDEAATCDWDALLPAAVARVLRVSDRASLRDELQKIFAPVAPTATFTSAGDPAPFATPSKGAATHLVRWRHFGLGRSAVYKSIREGRDEDDLVVERSVRVNVADPKACRSARLDASLQRQDGGEVQVFLEVRRPGQPAADTQHAVAPGSRGISVSTDIPADLQALTVGVRIRGRTSVTLENLSLTCEDGTRIPVAITSDWDPAGYSSLSRWIVAKCGTTTCGTLARNPLDAELVAERDIHDIDIGSGLRLRMPLAVWSDGQRTLPAGERGPWRREATIHDLSMRLAAVSATWATLALFYPYFEDQQTDWDAALPPALQAAAAARSPEDTHEVLSRLVARMRDDHARVTHGASPIDGIVPVAFRRFGDKLVTVGGLPEYADAFPPGTEVVEIDGVPALDAYDRVHQRVSAATSGWHEYATAYYLTVGRAGSFRPFRFRIANGKERVVALPLVSRNLYGHAIRESRPKTGSELAPGVFYVDLEGLQQDTWQAVLPTLQRARALVFDLRGYTTRTGMEVLEYITDRELISPPWQVPIVGARGRPQYEVSQWTMLPAATRLTAPVVVLIDGRSASAVETMLQMIRDAKLAYLVGETSGGTNGNTNSFTVPGGFEVRFTGMRVGGPDGTTIQGHGITPDKVVRPTLEGVRARRDEILEAGVAEALRLARGSTAVANRQIAE